MTGLPLSPNESMAEVTSQSLATPRPSMPPRSRYSAVMRSSSRASRIASTRSRSSVWLGAWRRLSASARSIGSPVSCSTIGPCGAITRAALSGTDGIECEKATQRPPNSASSRTRCRIFRRVSRPPQSQPSRRPSALNMRRWVAPRPAPASASNLLFDARCLAGAVAQVVELCAAHVAAALHGDRAERRAVGLEHALDALAVRDLAHGERGVEPAVAARDHHTLVGLDTLAVAFFDFYLDDDGVARAEVRHLALHALSFERGNDVGHGSTLSQLLFSCLKPRRILLRRIFLEQPPLLARQLTRVQQIRAPCARAPQRVPSPPALDLGVVAREQHRRHRPSFPHLGPRVVRPVEEPGRKRLVFRRLRTTKRARQQSCHGVDQHQRRQLTTGEHQVAYRYGLVDAALDEALIHALVPPGHQHKTGQPV